MRTVAVFDEDVTLLLAWLTITHAAREQLPSRPALLADVQERLVRERGEDDARDLLRGLFE